MKEVEQEERTADTLNGKKYTMMYNGEKYYISVFPGEIFFSTRRENHDSVSANLNTISRFVSMALQAHPLERVLDQLKKSSRSKNDVPAMLFDILSKNKSLHETDKGSDENTVGSVCQSVQNESNPCPTVPKR